MRLACAMFATALYAGGCSSSDPPATGAMPGMQATMPSTAAPGVGMMVPGNAEPEAPAGAMSEAMPMNAAGAPAATQAGAAGADAPVAGSAAGNTPPEPATPAVTECAGMPLGDRALAGAFDKRAWPAGLEEYWPTQGFRDAEPSELGLDGALLDEAIATATPGANTHAVLVTRHGYVAREYYAAGYSESSRFESFSMAKSFSSTLIGILIDRGMLASTDEPLCQFYDEWSCDAGDPYAAITIDHAMNVRTGLQWQEDWRSGSTGGNDIFRAITGVVDYTLDRPVVDDPGTHMRYSTGDPSLLTGVIEQLAGKSALEFAREALFAHIGTPDIRWASDGQGRTTTYAGVSATAREYAKFGYLFLRQGQWDGATVVSSEWVARATQGDEPCEDWYRYLWHQNPPIRLGVHDPDCPELRACTPLELGNFPPDTFFASGINGQFIFVVPSADMVVVRLASDGAGSENWDTFARGFLGKILDSVL